MNAKDETVIKEWEDKMERAATAASSLEAEQDNAKTVNGERQIQALVDKKKVIITETSIRRDLKLDDAEGTDCLPTATIFTELERMGAKTTAWNEFSSTMASAILQKTWVKIQLLLLISIPHPFITQPSSSKPQKKKSRRKQRKDSGPTKLVTDEDTHEEHVSTPSYDPPQSAKTDQAKEIASLKKRVKQLEKRRKSRTLGLKRLKKVTLIDETQGRKDEDLMFDTGVLDVTTAGDNVEIPDELTLAQTLIEIKSTKPKAITTAATTCILKGPYTPTIVTTPAVPATEDSLAVPEQTTVETVMNMTPENRAHFESEKEAIHLILTGIGDEIYSTVDACQTAQEMWEAIERLQQEWSRFVTIVKQQHKLDEVSYHKLFDILKQYQKEVNELRAERMAKNANPLALVATAHTLQDTYYQSSKPQKSYAPASKASLPTRSHATTRHKGKEIAKPITPPSESASEEDSDPEQAQRDKDMQKNLALIAKYFKKIYKPTNNNLRTSSNTRNKNVDTTSRYKNDNQTGQFGNQRAVNVAGARETVGGQVVQLSGIQCFNCKEFGHFAKECRKPKRVKDSTYHKEKMLLCKQAKKGVKLQAEQSDWLVDTDEEINEQELEAHYSYMEKIQGVPNANSGTDSEPLEQDDQNDVECDDERVALANLIANLKLDVDENKKIQKQLKKANATLTQELTECKSILAKTSRTLGESNIKNQNHLFLNSNHQFIRIDLPFQPRWGFTTRESSILLLGIIDSAVFTNRAHFESEKEAIHLILTGIGDEIYSTVDACKTAQEMWEAIERLQQGESLNIQDVKTNLFWEFGQFTSHDGETIESYYTRFYKMMNEMIRNNLTVATMQVNVQFLQQLQPEWSRFVTIVKQQHKLDEVSYHKLFDILKQYQKEVNELRAERMAKNANPLALVATAHTLQDTYYQSSKPQKSYAPASKASLPTRSHATTRYKGKEIAKPITPPSESASEEDSDPEQAQRDKDMQKILALIAKYFKKIYKPTNNNLRTSSNTINKNVDTTPRNLVTLLRNEESQNGLITPRITRKRCCCANKLRKVQYDTDDNVSANDIQHFEQSESISNTCVVETGDSNVIPDSPNMCDNDIQDDQCDDERVSLANLIANLKLDVDENKKIQKQLKKANATLTQELAECKSILAKTSRTLGESNSIQDSCLVALQNKQTELEEYMAFNNRTVDYEKLEHKCRSQ
ncbi:retrovirus-related pol polyprotein from transposon TNT 1-94 [Tanacetum coccineum]